MLHLNQKVPTFQFERLDHTVGSLSDFKGKAVVLYFYPKDNTPGCTQEACDFRDQIKDFEKSDAVVLGISRDSHKTHQNFVKKFALPFELISDQNEKISRLFDVIKEKSLYGKKYMGIERSTFLIDKNGVLRKEWRNVKVKDHVVEVLKFVREIA